MAIRHAVAFLCRSHAKEGTNTVETTETVVSVASVGAVAGTPGTNAVDDPNPNSPPPSLPPPLLPPPLWRNRDYLLLWFGQMVSSFGTQASGLALPLLILAVTGSPMQAGIAGGLRGAAYLLFGLPAGALVDRWNRRAVLVASDTLRAVALGSIPVALLLGNLTAVHLYAVSFVEGTLFIFFGLAETASLARVVPKRQLPVAVAQGQAVDSLSTMGGPPLGGALFGIAPALPFVVDALSYLVSVLAILGIRTPLTGERVAARRNLRAEIGAGIAWLRGQREVSALIGINGAVNLLYGGWSLLLIALVQQRGADPTTIGLIFTAGGVGSLIGVALSAPIQRRFTVGQIIIFMAWFFAVTWPPYALVETPFALGVVNAVGFLFVPVYVGTLFAYRLVLTPDALQGRVNSVSRLVTFGAQSLGFVLYGWLIESYGPVATVWITFVPAVLVAAATTLNGVVRRAPRIAHATVGG